METNIVAKEKRKKKKKDKAMTIPGVSPVSYFSLFRYASGADALLMGFGMLASLATGISFPIILIFFGDMTDAFVSGGISSESIHNLSCYLAENPNATVNVTR